MIYSKSVEYGIRALAHLAEAPGGGQCMARAIAEEEEMPAYFLAKTLQTLARHGLLRSRKGPTGGFSLNAPANKIHLVDIIEALDGLDALRADSPDLPSFRAVRSTILEYLRSTTISDVVKHRARRRKAEGRKRAARKSARSGS